MIQHVVEKAQLVSQDAFVATDDQRIYDRVVGFGGKVVMTSADHKSGTDRCCEAYRHIVADYRKTYDVVVNIQGDEPFVSPVQIKALCDCFDDEATQIATLGIAFKHDMVAISNPNSPKIVVDNNGYAMYFSRSVIPFVRGAEANEWAGHYPFLKHIGLYGYRRKVLEEITCLPPSSLEMAENLEQLRWLQNGYRIKVGITDIETIGIDTPGDLEKAEAYLASQTACNRE